MKVGWVSRFLVAVAVAFPGVIAAKSASAQSWTGPYLGANLGLGIGDITATTTGRYLLGAGGPIPSGVATLTTSGVLGGGQVGYNWQLAPLWVLGIEADFQGSSVKGSTSCLVTCGGNHGLGVVYTGFSATDQSDWFGTVRGRVGYASGQGLLYFTGGLAYGDVQRSAVVTGHGAGGPFGALSGSFSDTTTSVGWTIGGGVELKVWGAWSAKFEYLWVELGNGSDFLAERYASGAAGANRTLGSDFHENVLRLGLNYQLGGH